MEIEDLQKLSVGARKALELIKPSISTAELALNIGKKYPAEQIMQILAEHSFNKCIEIKMPDWSKKDLIAPPKRAQEQSSSHFTSLKKTEILRGERILDLCGGMGIDSYYFSTSFKEITHNDPDPLLSDIVQYNFGKLGIKNVTFTQSLAEEFVFEKKYDAIFVDPDRRKGFNTKKYSIEDCRPNMVDLLPKLLRHSPEVLIKLSPMLDLKSSVIALKTVKKIYVLSEKNEVKELLFHCTNAPELDPTIECCNLNTNQPLFQFTLSEESASQSSFSDPLSYLYEPNASILKAGAFKSLGLRYNLHKLAPSSHLYVSDSLIEHFSGRMFKIKTVADYDKKTLNTIIPNKKANVSIRNFPYSVAQILKNLGWKEGGDSYVFFSENVKSKKNVLICEKI